MCPLAFHFLSPSYINMQKTLGSLAKHYAYALHFLRRYFPDHDILAVFLVCSSDYALLCLHCDFPCSRLLIFIWIYIRMFEFSIKVQLLQ